MLIKKPSDVAIEPVEMEDAKGVTVQVLLGPKDGVPTFAMRMFELAPGGHTPYHSHPFEHEVIVMSGQIGIVASGNNYPLNIGDVILVEPDEIHQFRNLSDIDSAKMICMVPKEFQK